MKFAEITNLEPLHLTAKSQVYACRLNGDRAVLKVHTAAENYEQELFAYHLLRGGPIAKLLLENIDECALVLEKIPSQPLVNAREAAKTIGALHHYGIQRLTQLSGVGEQIELATGWKREYEARQFYSSICKTTAKPFAIGDIKAEHILSNRIIDLETFTLGILPLFDCLFLLNFANADVVIEDLIPIYLNSFPIEGDAETFVNLLRSFATHLTTIGWTKYDVL